MDGFTDDFNERCIRSSVCLNNFFKSKKGINWVVSEWFYSEIDKSIFFGSNKLQSHVNMYLPKLKTRILNISQWRLIKKCFGKRILMTQNYFIKKRKVLMQYRSNVRVVNQIFDCRIEKDNSFLRRLEKSLLKLPSNLVVNQIFLRKPKIVVLSYNSGLAHLYKGFLNDMYKGFCYIELVEYQDDGNSQLQKKLYTIQDTALSIQDENNFILTFSIEIIYKACQSLLLSNLENSSFQLLNAHANYFQDEFFESKKACPSSQQEINLIKFNTHMFTIDFDDHLQKKQKLLEDIRNIHDQYEKNDINQINKEQYAKFLVNLDDNNNKLKLLMEKILINTHKISAYYDMNNVRSLSTDLLQKSFDESADLVLEILKEENIKITNRHILEFISKILCCLKLIQKHKDDDYIGNYGSLMSSVFHLWNSKYRSDFLNMVEYYSNLLLNKS